MAEHDRRRLSRDASALALDLCGLPVRGRRERDRARARGRRGEALPRAPRRPGRHLHGARLDAARSLLLRHGNGRADLRLCAHARRPARTRHAREPARIRLPLGREDPGVLSPPPARARDPGRSRPCVGPPPPGGVQAARPPGFRGARRPDRLPAYRRALAGRRLDAPLRRHLVLPRCVRDRADASKRSPRSGDPEPRHARPDLARRDRHRAGPHRLRLLRHWRRSRHPARLQRRHEADVDGRERDRRLHRPLPHARPHRLALARRRRTRSPRRPKS